MREMNVKEHLKLHETVEKCALHRHAVIADIDEETTVVTEYVGGKIEWSRFNQQDGEDINVGVSYQYDFDSIIS